MRMLPILFTAGLALHAAVAGESRSWTGPGGVLITGEISWRLPPWNMLSWTNTQKSEPRLCDEKTGWPAEKIADLSATR